MRLVMCIKRICYVMLCYFQNVSAQKYTMPISVTVTNRERQLLDPETPHRPRCACKYIPFTMYVSNE